MRTIESIFREIESTPDFSCLKIDSVHYRNGCGDTPLHVVSVWGDCEAIEILVRSGADVNVRGETEFTPLHYAASHNHPKAISLLLKLGATNQENGDGDTPLKLAELLKCQEAIIELKKSP